MPNWCENVLTMTCSNKQTLETLQDAFMNRKFLNYLIPMPEGLQDSGSFLYGAPDNENRVKIEKENIEKYGFRDWYHWATQNWGTKWDVGASTDNKDNYPIVANDDGTFSLSLDFDSAWSPPSEALMQLTDHDVIFKNLYYEGGVGYCGYMTNENGYIHDVSFMLDGEREGIPEMILEQFSIDREEFTIDNDL
ncbi:hypothetical protein EBR57_03150 [bacterium]|nr:hypothetical protein [bacterium]